MSRVGTEEFAFVAQLVRERSAISIGPGKEYLVESRLSPLARASGYPDVNALIGELRRPAGNPRVRDLVVEAMTTNETSFFRDQHPFDALRTHLVPAAVKRNAARRKLAIWSAASSTGQELYSIAMLLDTQFPTLAGWDVRLLGTDLSSDVVAKARAGRYSPLEVNRGLPASLMVQYFDRAGADYAIDEKLRKRCEFQQMNLVAPWPVLPQFDVVFCRNVLIYFEVEVRRMILERIRRVLAPGGFLVLGGSETTVGVAEGFVAARVGSTVVYQVQK